MAKTKGKVVAKNVVDKKPNKLYFVDGTGSVRETAANRKGAKKGHKTCK